MMHIKVLGAGCANCHALEDRTTAALGVLGDGATVEMITDYAVIAGYGVMATPALVIDEQVVISGRVPDVDELVSIIGGSAR